MSNDGLPEAGDLVVTLPPEVLADRAAYEAVAVLPEDDRTTEGPGTAARVRRDAAVAAFLVLRDACARGDGDALAAFHAAAVRLVQPRLAAWRTAWEEAALAEALRTERPGWSLWRDGVPDGESIEQVASRADALLAEIAGAEGHAHVFSHGHFLRVVAARWLGLPATDGRLFALGPASISALGWEREQPVLSRWNDTAEGQTQPPA
jgi:hypothetical protein